MKHFRLLPVGAFFRRTVPRLGGLTEVRHRWRRIGMFLAVLGPGMITANVDNDAGEDHIMKGMQRALVPE